MDVSQIGYSSYPTTGVQSSGSENEITHQDFLNLLVSELSNQDPFEPMNSSEFMGQMLAIQDMQSQSDMKNTLEDLVHESRMGSAAGMMGLTVRGLNSANSEVIGVVTGLSVTGSAIDLVLNGNSSNTVELGKVLDVTWTQ